MKEKKIINLIMISILFLSACSKTNYTAGARILDVEKAEQEKIKREEKIIEEPKTYGLWKNLALSEKGNSAFVDLLSKSVYVKNRDYVERNVTALFLDELQEMVAKIEKDAFKSRMDYLFYDSHLKNDDSLLEQLLLSQTEREGFFLSSEKQFIIQAVAKVKSDLLTQILSAYDQKITENAKALAEFSLKILSEKRPDLKFKIEKSAQGNDAGLRGLIKDSLKEIQELDQLFKNSDLGLEDQVVVTAVGIVAEQAYKIVKDKKSFQEILKTYNEIKDLTMKVREIVALTTGVQNYQNAMKKDWSDFNDSIKGIYNDSSDLLSKSTSYEFKVDEKKIQNFLYDSLLGKRIAKDDGVNSSILSKEISLNKNFVSAVTQVEKMNGNFNLILDSTDKMAKILKVDLPPGFKKIAETAKKTNDILKTVNLAINGLKNGGIIGGLTAISSGPIMNLMGLNSDSVDPNAEFRGEVLAHLGVIDQKLDQVVSLQLETIKIQNDTMTLIKNVAVMIDAYHWQEMDALSDIKDFQLVTVEMEKLNLNQGLRSCERLFHYQLNVKRASNPYKFSPYDNIKVFDADIELIKSNMKSFEDIYKMISSTESSGWENCVVGINEAFGGHQLSENPIRSIYNSSENENFIKFKRYQYQPLVQLLNENKNKKRNIYFHLPVISFSSLEKKYDYMKNYQDQGAADLFNEHISTHSLQRYTMQLLAFYPFVNIDKDVWKEGIEKVLQAEIDQSETEMGSRGYYLLRNNLTLVQSAIAQEALLSGELILDDLFQRGEAALRSNVTSADGLAYAVATNKVLVMNLLRYSLIGQDTENKKGIFLKSYARAYESQDLVALSQFFSNRVVAQNIMLDKYQRIVLKLVVDKNEVTYFLPTPIELEEGHILYSENMLRLQELQKRVVDALVKLSPAHYSISEREKLARMMILP